MYSFNIGKAFQNHVIEFWLELHPKIKHEWKENELIIYHFKDSYKYSTFQFNSRTIKISVGDKRKKFRRKTFQNITHQVQKIMIYWYHEMLPKEELSIDEPKLKSNQIALMFVESATGIILTKDKSRFFGLGTVYQIFNNIKTAKDFIRAASKDETIEINAYNSNYKCIEI